MFGRKRNKQPIQITYGASSYMDLSSTQIVEMIHGLTMDIDSFLILESNSDIGNVLYLQTALPSEDWDDGLGYIVDLGTRGEEEGGKVVLYEYRTRYVEEVVTMFLEYYEKQMIPDHLYWDRQVMGE